MVVLGADAGRIAAELRGVEFVVNADWEKGRFTSLHAGLHACAGADGFLIPPVDTVGVSVETVAAPLAGAEHSSAVALRLRDRLAPGRILWLRTRLASGLMKVPASDLRVAPRLATIEIGID